MRRFTCPGLYRHIHIGIYYIYECVHRNWSLLVLYSLILSHPLSVFLSITHTHTNTIFPSANCCDRDFAESRPNGRAGPPCGIRPPLPIKEKNMEQEYSNMWVTHIISVHKVYIRGIHFSILQRWGGGEGNV